MCDQPPDESPIVPVYVLTGFLGAGKTSVLRALLHRSEFRHTALLINELGELGIDQLLVGDQPHKPVLLAGGCICCAWSADVGHALRDLTERHRHGLVPDFQRVIIETTGVADPTPVVQKLLTDEWLTRRYELRAVVAVVDAVNFINQTEFAPEASVQVAMADRVILSKADLATPMQRSACASRIAALNPSAPVQVALHGDVPTGFIIDALPWTSPSTPALLQPAQHGHSPAITSVSFECDGAFAWPQVANAFDEIFARFGSLVLRAKAIVRISGLLRPVLIQGVQGVFYPPELLQSRDSADTRTRVVLITRGVDAERVAEDLLGRLAGKLSAPALATGSGA